jgi:hypothetical protein
MFQAPTVHYIFNMQYFLICTVIFLGSIYIHILQMKKRVRKIKLFI